MIIHCEFCGTEYNSLKGNCPNCGAASGGNSEIEAQKRRDEETIKTFNSMAAAGFDKTHPYRERLTPKNKNIIRAIVILIAVLMGIGMAVFLVIRSMKG